MATSVNAAPVPAPAPPAAASSAQPPLSPATAAAGAHAQHANGGGAPAERSQGGGGSASTASNPPVERSISTTSVLGGGNGGRNGATTAELANAGEGAMYARLWHGMDQHDFINLECSVRHLADHVVELCGLPAGTLVDLCTERGRLLELPTRFVDTQPSQVLVERADDVLRRGYVYLPVLVAAEAPSPPPHTTGSYSNHHHHGVSESRPSSSRSPIGSRHGTAGAGKGRRAGAGGAPDAGCQPTAPATAAAAVDAAGGVAGMGPHSGNGASGTGQQEDGPSAVAHNAALLAAEAAHTALNTTVTTVATAADDVKIYYHVLLNPSVLSQHLPSFELQVRGAKVSAKTPKSSSLRRGNSRK